MIQTSGTIRRMAKKYGITSMLTTLSGVISMDLTGNISAIHSMTIGISSITAFMIRVPLFTVPMTSPNMMDWMFSIITMAVLVITTTSYMIPQATFLTIQILIRSNTRPMVTTAGTFLILTSPTRMAKKCISLN